MTAMPVEWYHADGPDHVDRSLLTERFGAAPDDLDVACRRMVMTFARPRADYVFVLAHALDDDGRLFPISLLIGATAVATVLGPRPDEYVTDVGATIIEEVRGRVTTSMDEAAAPGELAAAVIAAIAERLEQRLGDAASAAGILDREMRHELPKDPERFLDAAFKVRHDLVTVGNRLTQTREVCALVADSGVPGCREPFEDLRVRFSQLRTRLDGEAEFLQGVLDYYESLTTTKMNIAMERLAVIAAVALPVSAIGGILGMNTIVADETSLNVNVIAIVLMLALTAWMLVWARRRGWW